MKIIPLFTSSVTPLTLSIACNNWREEYPYSPEVRASIWHDNKNIYLKFFVLEEFIAATAQKDNDKVCNDSCVEFFIAFDNGGYYNIEANCSGTVLMSHRKSRKENVKYASEEILRSIERSSSLGSSPFDCKNAEGEWQLTLKIPVSAFFLHDFRNLSGIKATCNIYKCGDLLPKPHFLSLAPITTPHPDFHQPSFFIPITFE